MVGSVVFFEELRLITVFFFFFEYKIHFLYVLIIILLIKMNEPAYHAK
jgi:hypothetical protein